MTPATRPPLPNEFVTNTSAEGWVFGPGTAGARLGGLLARVGSQRPYLLTTPSLTATPLLSAVQEAVGEGLVGTFAEPCQHTPRSVVLAAADAVAAANADGLVVFGGSSVVDLAKGVAMVLAEGRDFDALMLRFTPGHGSRVPRLRAPKLPQVDVPTTLSGAEFTGAAGITDPERGSKDIYLDAKLCPRWVILDAELASATPARLWAGTGMKIVADAIEIMTSRRSSLRVDAVARASLELLMGNLVPASEDPDDLDARGACLYAVGMLIPNLLNAGLGLTAGLRHQIGAGYGVPHGEASTIVLPHVLRWNAPVAGEDYDRIAAGLGLAGGNALITSLEELTAKLGLPRRLRDVGIPRDALEPIADHVLGDLAVGTNAREVQGRDDVLEVLAAAW